MVRLLLVLALCTPLLQGCAVAVIGATVGTTAVLLDSRDVNQQLDDSGMRLAVSNNLQQVNRIREQQIKFVVFNGDVLLYGQAESEQISREAERQARAVSGVVNVFNQIRVRERSKFINRGDDVLITSRVKARLIREQNYDTSTIRVITDNNEVFLLGIVDRATADRAIEITRNVRGVERVIDVLTVKGE